jgi:integrase
MTRNRSDEYPRLFCALPILLLLSRLGIRALEAAQLQIDDVDWRTGCVLIRASKNHRERNLPLSEDVGQALLD